MPFFFVYASYSFTNIWFRYFLLHDIFISFFPRYLAKTLIVNFQIYFKALDPYCGYCLLHIGEVGKMKGTDLKRSLFLIGKRCLFERWKIFFTMREDLYYRKEINYGKVGSLSYFMVTNFMVTNFLLITLFMSI